MRGFLKTTYYLFLISFFAINLCIFAESFQEFSLPASENQSVQKLTTTSRITVDELEKWDQIVQGLLTSYALGDGGIARLKAYLYNAQEAFAKSSHQISGEYSGTLDPISFYVLQLFFPNYQEKEASQFHRDAYSNELSALLAKKIGARFNSEQAAMHPIAYTESKDAWKGTPPFLGLIIPSMRPWKININEFIAPAPPPPTDAAFWNDQLAQVKKAMEEATESQKNEIIYWAGLAGQESGDWIEIANKYMKGQQLPLEKQLEVRSTLSAADLDTLIAVFATKYKYMVRRPNMLDKNLKTYIKTPNHPSYPAGHSTCSASLATILSFYFPENKNEWERLSESCGLSRIRAGIHFPIDHTAGKALGSKVGQAFINR